MLGKHIVVAAHVGNSMGIWEAGCRWGIGGKGCSFFPHPKFSNYLCPPITIKTNIYMTAEQLNALHSRLDQMRHYL